MTDHAQNEPTSTRLKHLATIRSSNVDKTIEKDERGVRLCNYVHVYYNDVISDLIGFEDGSATSSQIDKFALIAGDVVITKDSETPDDIAIPAIVDESAEGVVCGYHLAILRPVKAKVHPSYLFWSLKSKPVRDAFKSAAKGVTRFGLTLNSIGSVEILLPGIEQQQAIAHYLDRETARIDQLISKKRTFSKVLADRVAAATDDSILGVNLPQESIGVERSGFMTTIPKGWSVKPLGHLVDPRRQIMYGIVLPGPHVEGGVPI